MALDCLQPIYSGSALIYIGAKFTSNICADPAIPLAIVETGGYTITASAIPVGTGEATLTAPNVAVESAELDPPVTDILCNLRTREIMVCYSKDTTADELNVVRGVSLWWDAQNFAKTTYAAVGLEDDEIQNLGTGTFPNWKTGIVFTDQALTITATYNYFMTRDNQRGNSGKFISSPATVTLETNIPRNVLPKFKSVLNKPRISDSATTPSYFAPIGVFPAGTQMLGAFIVVVPNEQWFGGETITVNTKDYKSHTRAFLIPNACIDLNEVFTFNEGAQLNIATKWDCLQDDVFCMPIFQGWFVDAHRLLVSGT